MLLTLSFEIMKNRRRTSLSLLAALLFFAVGLAPAAEMFEQSPMNYSATQPNDAIARLQARLAGALVKLGGRKRDLILGLLRELKVPESGGGVFQDQPATPAHQPGPSACALFHR